jgi:hypothetical protein
MIWVPVVVVALVVGLGAVVWTTSLSRAFEARKAEVVAVPRKVQPALTEADIAHLPPPVQRYIALTGSIGRPVVTEITMRFDATMYDAPGAAGMTGPVEQFERFDTPERLFFMTSRMKGLPVAVLHDFSTEGATMTVRLAGLFNVVELGGPEATRTETVTFLNDLAFYAPSRLADPRLAWTAIDVSRARVGFTLGPNTVSAELVSMRQESWSTSSRTTGACWKKMAPCASCAGRHPCSTTATSAAGALPAGATRSGTCQRDPSPTPGCG